MRVDASKDLNLIADEIYNIVSDRIIKKEKRNMRVIEGMSGGVDSSVAAYL